MESLIKPEDCYLAQWTAFIQQTKAYSLMGEGGKQHLSVLVFGLSLLGLRLLCFSLDGFEMV